MDKMVYVVCYDLPVKTRKERSEANAFNRLLLRCGYKRMQKSVYVKLVRNRLNSTQEITQLRTKLPSDGSIFVLPIALDDFHSMQCLSKEVFDMKLFADDVIIV